MAIAEAKLQEIPQPAETIFNILFNQIEYGCERGEAAITKLGRLGFEVNQARFLTSGNEEYKEKAQFYKLVWLGNRSQKFVFCLQRASELRGFAKEAQAHTDSFSQQGMKQHASLYKHIATDFQRFAANWANALIPKRLLTQT